MIYITGDTHGSFTRLLAPGLELEPENVLVILGDSGINYRLNSSDDRKKEILNNFGITVFAIPGNHEERAENISSYKEVERFGGTCYVEDRYPNILFAKSGEEYDIEDNHILVIGGAYSIDKHHRLRNRIPWFKSEQLTKKEKKNIFNKVKGNSYDFVFSHTCPYKYIPREAFLEGVDQSLVDNSMEFFLDDIEENITYGKWYCGHFHIEKELDNIEFMYYGVKELERKKNKVLEKK